MAEIIMPEGYLSPLTIRETEVAIKEVKDHSMKNDAKEFRRQLEEIQYERKNINGDKQ